MLRVISNRFIIWVMMLIFVCFSKWISYGVIWKIFQQQRVNIVIVSENLIRCIQEWYWVFQMIVELIVSGLVINGSVRGMMLMFFWIVVFDFFCLFCLFLLSLLLIIDIVMVIIRMLLVIWKELMEILKICRMLLLRNSDVRRMIVIDRLVVRLVLLCIVVG